eukprot:2863978-Alexandrium_andersonii.AAC.1
MTEQVQEPMSHHKNAIARATRPVCDHGTIPQRSLSRAPASSREVPRAPESLRRASGELPESLRRASREPPEIHRRA